MEARAKTPPKKRGEGKTWSPAHNKKKKKKKKT